MAQELEENTDSSRLPISRLFSVRNTDRVLDLLLEAYNMSFTKDEISKISGLSEKDTENILKHLLNEKIIKNEKSVFDLHYRADFSSNRTTGLFEYTRATLDDNFERNLNQPTD